VLEALADAVDLAADHRDQPGRAAGYEELRGLGRG
jgi:hypothetical protein